MSVVPRPFRHYGTFGREFRLWPPFLQKTVEGIDQVIEVSSLFHIFGKQSKEPIVLEIVVEPLIVVLMNLLGHHGVAEKYMLALSAGTLPEGPAYRQGRQDVVSRMLMQSLFVSCRDSHAASRGGLIEVQIDDQDDEQRDREIRHFPVMQEIKEAVKGAGEKEPQEVIKGFGVTAGFVHDVCYQSCEDRVSGGAHEEPNRGDNEKT